MRKIGTAASFVKNLKESQKFEMIEIDKTFIKSKNYPFLKSPEEAAMDLASFISEVLIRPEAKMNANSINNSIGTTIKIEIVPTEK